MEGTTEGEGTTNTAFTCGLTSDDDFDDAGDSKLNTGTSGALSFDALDDTASEKTYTISTPVEYNPDTCVEDDEWFSYKVVPVTKGLLAGDPDAGTYEEITFTIRNDDGKRPISIPIPFPF